MIVKAVFGDKHTHIRMIDCKDIHLEDTDNYTELICHRGDDAPMILHLGKHTADILYIMEQGQTVDSLVFPLSK